MPLKPLSNEGYLLDRHTCQSPAAKLRAQLGPSVLGLHLLACRHAPSPHMVGLMANADNEETTPRKKALHIQAPAVPPGMHAEPQQALQMQPASTQRAQIRLLKTLCTSVRLVTGSANTATGAG